jgi:hypothetical protein
MILKTAGPLLILVICLAAIPPGNALAHDPAGGGTPPEPLGGDVPFKQVQTEGNALGLVMTNYGFFGNNFVTRAPSMEYPLGSDIEHLIRAGVWIGAINAEGDTVVSSGAISGYWGTSTASATEFSPADKIRERSVLITSRAYSEDAVSEQDFITEYTDYPLRGSNDNVLQVSVRQEAYLWSYKFAEAFVIVSLTIRNDGAGFLTKPTVGVFAELSSGWKGAYDTWRPSGSAWFKKKMLEYFEDLRMVGEHHYNYQGGAAPAWGAVTLLGSKHTLPVEQVNVSFNWWDWYWERDNPMEDEDRFILMTNREQDETIHIMPEADDPVELLSAGPFPEMAPGDSMVVVFAFLGGMDREALVNNAEWAHRAFDNDYVLPSPPQPSRFRIKPERGAISIHWDDYPEDKLDPFYKIADFEGYRIYVTRTEGATSEEFDLIREVDVVNGIGYDTGLADVDNPVTIGDTLYDYSFRIDNLKDGFKYWVSLTSFDRGIPEEGVESMESGIRATRVMVVPGTPPAEDGREIVVFPNPYRGEAVWDGPRDREKYVWFANLPRRATIRIYSLAGDLVKTIEFDGADYDGSDVQGLGTAGERDFAIPGGLCAWDLITDEDQAVASGLYIYSVRDKETGGDHIGKLMIIR